MIDRKVILTFATLLSVHTTSALAQDGSGESLSACAQSIDDFGPCLALVTELGKAIADEKARLDKDDPRLAALTEHETRIAAAQRAFQDLAARTAKLREVEAELAAAEKRRNAAQAPAARAYEQLLVDGHAKEQAALNQALATVRAGAFQYADLALTSYPVRRSEGEASPPRTDSCRDMIENPKVTLGVKSCAVVAMTQSASFLPGGEIKIPGSVLNPPGFSAVLSGGETGGNVTLTLSQEHKVRRKPRVIPDGGDPFVQRAISWGSSIGLKAGEGTLFSRDTDVQDFDQIDDRAALTASLFVNFFSAERSSHWNERAKALTDAALAACRADQQLAKPVRVSSCRGESLTNWVYALGPKGELLNKSIADQANALYFGGRSPNPRFGGGITSELARSSHEYLLPTRFATFFDGDFNDDAFRDAAFQRSSSWVASISPYAYVRLTPENAKVGISLIPSYTIATTLGYPDGYEKPLFCPPLATDAPFSTADCKRYNAEAPTSAEVETWALEVRSAFRIWGDIDLIAAPKVSWNDKDRTQNHPWLVSLPVLAFTDLARTSAVGFKVDWAFGQVDAAGAEEDDDLAIKLVYQKAFNLTGR